jgi:hypothetical protein
MTPRRLATTAAARSGKKCVASPKRKLDPINLSNSPCPWSVQVHLHCSFLYLPPDRGPHNFEHVLPSAGECSLLDLFCFTTAK